MLFYLIYFFIIFYIVIGIIILSEIAGYLWHRFAAHTDILHINLIHETHKIHHDADLTHEAHEDFFWLILLLTIMGIFVWYQPFLNRKYAIIIYLIVVIVFVWNWYIHSAYHISNHWLNNYDWFKKDKKIHFQHHINPWSNYGIASHFSDIICGTFDRS